MAEMINKWDAVNKLIRLENEYNFFKWDAPTLYRKLCEVEIEIGKMPGAGWIPVGEKMPNEKGTYLVCTDNFGIVFAHWYGDKFGGGHASKHITHWMPVPEPPKEG